MPSAGTGYHMVRLTYFGSKFCNGYECYNCTLLPSYPSKSSSSSSTVGILMCLPLLRLLLEE